MGPGAGYAIMTFATGVMLLMAWLYANIDNARSGAIFKKSLLLFALPNLLWPGRVLLHLPLGIWLAAACEEGLKAFASTRERSRRDKFWFVALFGIWELTISKPIWGLDLAQAGVVSDRLSTLEMVCITALPVLMHTVTAVIYAFASDRRLWASFGASWIIHAMFNESVEHFGVSPHVAIAETAVLAAMLAGLILSWRQWPVSESG